MVDSSFVCSYIRNEHLLGSNCRATMTDRFISVNSGCGHLCEMRTDRTAIGKGSSSWGWLGTPRLG